MQTDVSVKKPTRGLTCSPYVVCPSPTADCALLLAGGDPRVRRDELRQRAAPRAAAGEDVARRRLDLLDVDVRVERDREEVVRRVAGREALAAPVVGQPDLVHLAALHGQRAQA